MSGVIPRVPFLLPLFFSLTMDSLHDSTIMDDFSDEDHELNKGMTIEEYNTMKSAHSSFLKMKYGDLPHYDAVRSLFPFVFDNRW